MRQGGKRKGSCCQLSNTGASDAVPSGSISKKIGYSDIILLKELLEAIRNSIEAYVGCISGAMLKHECLNVIKEAGFKDVRIVEEKTFPIELITNDPGAKAVIKKLEVSDREMEDIGLAIQSITVEGVKGR